MRRQTTLKYWRKYHSLNLTWTQREIYKLKKEIRSLEKERKDLERQMWEASQKRWLQFYVAPKLG